ncbi:MAG: hypothetical protein MZV63_23490 [Marinilabiliales bacterium]|nr:hypothetical protein [Marinilabiliales bacterium]
MTADLTDTAIILADEKLLLPVLTSLPQSMEEVNVTMGHPFPFHLALFIPEAAHGSHPFSKD